MVCLLLCFHILDLNNCKRRRIFFQMFSSFAVHTLLLNVYSIHYNKVKSFFISTPIFIFLKASVHKRWKHNHKLIMGTFSDFLYLPLITLLLSNQCKILLHNIFASNCLLFSMQTGQFMHYSCKKWLNLPKSGHFSFIMAKGIFENLTYSYPK